MSGGGGGVCVTTHWALVYKYSHYNRLTSSLCPANLVKST